MNAKMTILFCILSDYYYKLSTTHLRSIFLSFYHKAHKETVQRRAQSLSAIFTHYTLFLIHVFIDNNNE